MTWSKSAGTVTAKTDSKDLKLSFYYSDEDATPPNALYVRLTVDNDGNGALIKKTESVAALLTATSLTAGERSTLLGLLAKIRDDGLTALGYTES